MSNRVLNKCEVLFDESFETIRDFLRGKAGKTDDERAHKRASIEIGMKSAATYSRLRATRANEAAITLAAAKMMGLAGDELKPLWKQLTDQSDQKQPSVK